MHVLHVIDGLGLGGAERMLVDIANATAKDGNKVSVCITRHETLLTRELESGVAVKVLGRRRRLSVSASADLARWVHSRHVDVLHVHMRSSLAFVLLLRAVRAVRRPIVFHDHYGLIETDTSTPRWFRIGAPLIAQYVGVSERLREWALRGGVKAERASTIPNAIDTTRITAAAPVDVRRTLGLEPQTSLGVIAASFKREKGLDVLIDALARSRHRDRVHVVVAGGGTDSAFAHECRARVREHGLEKAITFLGGRDDVPGLVQAADFALLGSHSESGPLVLVEYLLAGKPIVSTLVGDIGHRLAAAGVPGFVPPGDAGAFAVALDELLDQSRAQRAARGEVGRAVVQHGWDIRETMPRWYEVYRSAIAGRA